MTRRVRLKKAVRARSRGAQTAADAQDQERPARASRRAREVTAAASRFLARTER
ncbi:hypothetical protein [Streptomyces sp. NPDC059009]|uniref:hypothetical protein n=1 Tax=Streptomyces sp. NPDC059009 TaxID=3346694 RepID=UPI0036C21713